MVTDEQVRRLRKLSYTERNQEIAASKAGMDPTTARRYLGLERLPSELKKERSWRTREDPFGEVWDAVQQQIQESPGLEAKTLFEWLQREYRHIIEWLVRKPGAFENYRYQEDLFPTSRFRMAYDALKETTPGRSSQEHLG